MITIVILLTATIHCMVTLVTIFHSYSLKTLIIIELGASAAPAFREVIISNLVQFLSTAKEKMIAAQDGAEAQEAQGRTQQGVAHRLTCTSCTMSWS